MARTGLIYHPIYLEHDTDGHPERKERLTTTLKKIESSDLDLEFVTPRPATLDEVGTIHSSGYIDQVRSISERGEDTWTSTPSSPGNPTRPPSWRQAEL